MTTFLLIRHAEYMFGDDALPGRTAGVGLSQAGRAQAAALADRLAQLPIRAIYASPLDRAHETAQPLAARLGLAVQVAQSLNEVEFGRWNGKTMSDLARDPRWRLWNSFRGGTRAPDGELLLETQSRIVAEMLRLRERHHGQCIALFSHGDVIRAALAHWLGVHVDLFLRIKIDLASVSIVTVSDTIALVRCVNHCGALRCE